MSANNPAIQLEAAKHGVDFLQKAAEAIDDSTEGLAVGAKTSSTVLKGGGHLLQAGIAGVKIKNAAPEDKVSVATNEATKFVYTTAATYAGTVAFAWTGPAAPIFGLAVGALTGFALDYAEAQTGVGLGELIFIADYNGFDQNTPSNGVLKTEFVGLDGTSTISIEHDAQTGETRYINADLDVTRFKVNDAGGYEEIEFTKNGNTVGLNLKTGDYSLTDVNGNNYTGNLADASVSPEVDAVLGSMLDDFNVEIKQTDPSFDIWTDVVDTMQGSSSDLTVQISGRHLLASDDFVIDGQNEFGGTTIDYKGLSISTDSLGQTSVRTINPATGDIRGIFFNQDGTKTVFYNDPSAVDGVAEYTYTDLSELGVEAQYVAQQVIYEAAITLREGAQNLLLNHPELLGDLAALNLPSELQAILEKVVAESQAAQGGPGKIYDVTPETSSTSADGTVTYQTKNLFGEIFGPQQISDADLAYFATNAADEFADLRTSAFWELHARAVASATVSTNASGNLQYDLPSGYYLEVVNTGDPLKSVELIKAQGVSKPVGVVTTYGGNFQQQVVEVLDGDTNSVVVDIVTTNEAFNQAFTNGTITLVYPESFIFSDAGGYVGNMLGQQLADADVYKGILYKSALTTVGQNLGAVLDFLGNGTETLDSIFGGIFGANTNEAETGIQARPDLFEGFIRNLQGSVASAVGVAIVDELGEIVEIGGVGGEIFDIAAGTVTTGFVSGGLGVIFDGLDANVFTHLINSDFNFGAPLDPNFVGPPGPDTVTIGDQIQTEIFNALAAYAGARLAGEIIEPDSEMSAILGSIGATIASVTSLGTTIGQALGLFGGSGGPVGAAIGAFVGNLAGTVIGNLLSDDQEAPAAWSGVYYDSDARDYVRADSWGEGGVDASIAKAMADKVLQGVNHILDLTHGDLRSTASARGLTIGWKEGSYVVSIGGGEKYFGRSGDAIEYATFRLLKEFDLVGGHAVIMRAWHNSDATTLQEFQEDISVAEAFQAYLIDPASVIAFMLNEPDSENAQAWAAVLQRAAELELHLPHEKDLDGGWAELLLARGDINPELVPEIEGGDLVLTDPITGEETTLQYVIGPGYEIVRVEGADGDDILQVNIDGPSIGYATGGEGSDWLVGSDANDILLGGPGDDSIFGEGGDDWLNGGTGDDFLDGGIGDDLIVGGPGDDELYGGAGYDRIYGGDGNDYIDGEGVTDELYGGAGDDTLLGNDETTNSILKGGDGNDTLHVKSKDYSWGGKGDDTFILTGSKNFVYISRDEGHDTVIAPVSTQVAPGNENRIVFDESIGVNDIWITESPDDSRDAIIHVLGEDQTVLVQNYFASSGVHNGYIEIEVNGGPVTIASAWPLPAGDLPTLPNNVFTDSYLAANQSYIPFIPKWAGITVDSSVHPGVDPYLHYSPGTANIVAGDNTAETFQNWWNDAIVYGGQGDDTITGFAGAVDNRIYGDSGDDTIYAYDGYGSEDILVGGLGDDTVYGYDGDDRIWGSAGQDIIHGGTGDDELYGGHDNDDIHGDEGDDFIRGGGGDDTLHGNAGADEIHGDDGNDVIEGNTETDSIYGGAGDDSISGGSGDDYLEGGEGADNVTGDHGNDIVFGGSGDDILDGGKDEDHVSGGAGNDRLVFNVSDHIDMPVNTSTTDVVPVLTSNTAGPVIITHSSRYAPSTGAKYHGYRAFDDSVATKPWSTKLWTTTGWLEIDLPQPEVINKYQIFSRGDQPLSIASASAPNSWTFEGFDGTNWVVLDTVTGETDWGVGEGRYYTFDNTEAYQSYRIDVTANNGSIYYLSIGEMDLIAAQEESNPGEEVSYDIYNGGDDTDTLVLNLTAAEFAQDRVQRDILRLKAEQANATLTSLAFAFTAFALTVSDVELLEVFVDGVLQDLQYNLIDGDITDETINGTAGHDEINAGDGNDTINGGEGHDYLKGDAGDDIINGEDGLDYIRGGEGNDTVSGGAGDDEIEGGEGDDSLSGDAGADIIAGGKGADDLSGGDDNDALSGGSGDDTIAGDAGDDVLYGEGGNDQLYGGEGDDVLYGNIGDDVLDGGAGSDALIGGSGSDTFVFKQATAYTGSDTIHDFSLIEGDSIEIYDLLAGQAVSESTLANFVRISEGATDSVLEIDSAGNANSYVSIATLSGVTGLADVVQLAINGTLQVTDGTNTAPEAFDDSFVMLEDGVLAANVLADNGAGADSDADNDTLQVIEQAVTTVYGGAVIFGATGDFTYTPPVDFNGNDSFVYTITDGKFTAVTAAVNIAIDPVNDAPVATNTGGTVSADDVLTLSTSMLDATDVDNADSELVFTVNALTAGGTLKRDGIELAVNDSFTLQDIIDGLVTYEPDLHFFGTDGFEFTVSDGTVFLPAETFSISVSPATPFAVSVEAEDMVLDTGPYPYDVKNISFASGGSYVELAGGSSTGIMSTGFTGVQGTYDIAVSFFDESDGMASYQLRVNGQIIESWLADQDYGEAGISTANLVSHTVQGLGLLNGDVIELYGTRHSGEAARVDKIEFTPVQTEPTPYAFTMEAEDMVLDTGSYPYDVKNISFASGGSYVELAGGSATGIISTDFGGIDATYDLTVSYFDESDGVASYELKVNGQTIASWVADQDYAEAGISTVNLVSRTVQGLDLVRGDLIELHGTRHNGEAARVDKIEFAISQPNTVPVAADDSFVGPVDTDILGNLLADNGNGVDSDPDSDPLSVVAETITTTNGSVAISANGDFIYTPDAGYTGADSFTYTLLDGNGGTDTGNVTLNLATVITGTSANDLGGTALNGTANADIIYGLEGTDHIYGHAGDDLLDGGDGNDMVRYNTDPAGVTVNLATGVATDGYGDTDTLVNIERARGGDFVDTLIGDSAKNTLYGEDGNDILYGGADNDTLYGDADNDTLYGEDGNDNIQGGTGNDILYGGNGDDNLYGHGGNDVLYGGDGYDVLNGGNGTDTIVFESASAFNDVDRINSFDISDNNAIDISDVLFGYDPLTDAITDFVQITDNGTHSYLAVDVDGGGDNFIQIAEIRSRTGLTDEEALETSGNLITSV